MLETSIHKTSLGYSIGFPVERLPKWHEIQLIRSLGAALIGREDVIHKVYLPDDSYEPKQVTEDLLFMVFAHKTCQGFTIDRISDEIFIESV